MPTTKKLIFDTESMTPAWTVAHDAAAALEGWGIFECDGSENGPWQIQKFDASEDHPGSPQLSNDDDAWRLVLQGDLPHHAAAIEFMKAHNEAEHVALLHFKSTMVN